MYAKIMSYHESSSSFWKSNAKAVPGRPSPKKEVKSSTRAGKSGVGSSFQDYQQSVSDAWDTGDDEFCIISGIVDTRISRRVSESAALNVIETHKSNNLVNKSHDNTVDEYLEEGDTQKNSETGEKFHTDCANNSDSTKNKTPSNDNTNEYKSKFRQFHAYPGRPHLQRISSNSQDCEYESKIEKFNALLVDPNLDLATLRKLSWSGLPKRIRAITWRLLSKYLPTSIERRSTVLQNKRTGYQELRKKYFVVDSQEENKDTYRQIHIDVPRTNPHIPLFQQEVVQEMFERILFIWAIRHPASGYVQGINDLVTPFFIVFLQEYAGFDRELENFEVASLTLETRENLEADAFWCLSKLLDCVQDNYIFAQLGIQEKINQLKDLIRRIDGTLHNHLQNNGVDYLQFSFRWMNNLLTRELPLHCTIRLWDTYLAESDGFAVFHLYVCAAFLLHWREQLLQEKDFQGLMILLQNLPTHNWTDRQINMLVAEAFRLKFIYADTPKHLEGKS